MIGELLTEVLFLTVILLLHLLPAIFVGGLIITLGLRDCQDRYKLKDFCKNTFRFFIN